MRIRPARPGTYTLACGLTLLAVVAIYANHFQGDFHFDDHHTIANNRSVRDLRNIPLFFSDTRTISALPANQSYRPLLLTTLAVDYWLGGGLDTTWFHVTSFALFLAQLAAMLFLFRRLMDLAWPHGSNRWIALAATVWYGVHTANAETVNYILARSEILSTLGAVLAVLLFARGGRSRRWGLYLIPAAASVLAKEHGAMTAPLLFCYVALFEHERSLGELLRPRQFAAVLRETWPAFLVCGIFVTAGLWAATWYMAGSGGISRWHYLLAQPFVLLHYVFAFFLPVNLSADTDWKAIANPFDDRVIAGVIFIACAVWLIAVTSRRRETRPIRSDSSGSSLRCADLERHPAGGSDQRPSDVLSLRRLDARRHLGDRTRAGGLATAPRGAKLGARARHRRRGAAHCRTRRRHVAAQRGVAHGGVTLARRDAQEPGERARADDVRRDSDGQRRLRRGAAVLRSRAAVRPTLRLPARQSCHPERRARRLHRGGAPFPEAQQYDPANPVSYMYYARWLDSVGASTRRWCWRSARSISALPIRARATC